MKYMFARMLQSRFARLRELRKYLWNMDALRGQRKNRYLAEQLEARNLLSADLAPFAGDQAVRDLLDNDQVLQQLIDSAQVDASNDMKTPWLERETLPDFISPDQSASLKILLLPKSSWTSLPMARNAKRFTCRAWLAAM